MALITKILKAVHSGELTEPFTVEDLKLWMQVSEIRKDDGSDYAESSINAILANSDLKNQPTSNLNKKILTSTINASSKKIYWFQDNE